VRRNRAQGLGRRLMDQEVHGRHNDLNKKNEENSRNRDRCRKIRSRTGKKEARRDSMGIPVDREEDQPPPAGDLGQRPPHAWLVRPQPQSGVGCWDFGQWRPRSWRRSKPGTCRRESRWRARSSGSAGQEVVSERQRTRTYEGVACVRVSWPWGLGGLRADLLFRGGWKCKRTMLDETDDGTLPGGIRITLILFK
jgi:hypothetical protein